MNERMQRLVAVFRSAEADVDASQKRLREASSTRLAELLRLPAAHRLQALHDPVLSAFDRATLERSIEDALPKRLARVPRRWTVSGRTIRRFAWHHRHGLFRLALAIGPVGFFAAQAWLHTPPANAKGVKFTAPLPTTWAMPDGTSFKGLQPDPAGTEAVWYRKGATGMMRRWFPGQGYGRINSVPDYLLEEGYIQQR